MRELDALQEEYERWRFKRKDLEDELKALSEEENDILKELARVEGQISYYDSLESDMKRELEPPRLSDLLSSFGKR
jgi:chromosome segregation ATPase